MKAKRLQSSLLRRIKIFWKRNFAIILSVALMVLFAWYSLKVEPNTLRATEFVFASTDVPAELDGFVIAFVADVHINDLRIESMDEVINLIKKRQVDLLLLGGDYVNGNGRGHAAESFLKYLRDLSIPCGIYAIPGNHDYRRGIADIKRAFAEFNIPLLFDQRIVINNTNGGKFELIGLDYLENPHHASDKKRLSRLQDGNESPLQVVFMHTPSNFPFLSQKADLVLSGHTHGGQLYLPGIGSVINPTGYGRKYTYGYIEEGSKKMFISAGLGSAYTQARFCMKPEVLFVTLKRTEKN